MVITNTYKLKLEGGGGGLRRAYLKYDVHVSEISSVCSSALVCAPVSLRNTTPCRKFIVDIHTA